MKLKDKIMGDRAILEVVHEDYIKALRKYENIKYPIKGKQKTILDKFRSAVNKNIKTAHNYECCSPKYYNDAWFTDEGITMRINADHPNDRHYSDWSWEEIDEILA